MRPRVFSREDEVSLFIISDLHMGDGGPHERFHSDELIREFIGHLENLLGGSPERVRLLLLGDLLDLSLVGRAFPNQMVPVRLRDQLLIERVEDVRSAHSGVFTALQQFIERGGTVEVVPGNSDGALRVPAVWEHFRQSLLRGYSTPRSQAQLRLHPWIYHVPGVVYAEHGNQYHEINSFPALLQGLGGAGPEQLETIGSLLDAYGGSRHAEFDDARAGATSWAASLAAQYMRASKVRRTVGYVDLLEEYAQEVFLPPVLVAELDTFGSRAVWRSGLRALRRSGPSRWRRRAPSSDAYLRDAALRIHRAALRRGSSALFYVFGHTHAPCTARIEDESSRYVNCGTWSTATKGSLAQPTTPYVQITLGTEPSCLLLDWERKGQETSRPVNQSSSPSCC
jgi:UDP-2,3-diacylglucosamine pyrophosphatase LpxH